MPRERQFPVNYSVVQSILGKTFVETHTSGAGHGTGSYTTGAFTPSNSSLLVVAVTGAVGDLLTVADRLTITDSAGLSWSAQRVLAESLTSNNDFVVFYTAPVTTGVSMTITVDCGAGYMYRYIVHVYTFTNYNVASPVGATGSYGHASGATPVTHELSGAPAATSYLVAGGFLDGGAWAYGTGWTGDGSSAPDVISAVQSKTSTTSTTVTWDNLANFSTGVCSAAIEIKAA